MKNYPSGASTLRAHVPLRGIHDRSSVMHAHDRWSVMFWPLTMALRAPYEALSFRKLRKISHLAPSKSYTSKNLKIGYARSACSRALPEHFPSTPRALPEHFPSTPRALPEHFPSTSRALPEHFPSTSRALPASTPRALPEHFPSTPRALPEHSKTAPDRLCPARLLLRLRGWLSSLLSLAPCAGLNLSTVHVEL